MNLVEQVAGMIDAAFRSRTFVATCKGTSGANVLIRRTGQAADDAQAYPKLASYTSPTNGDVVIVQRVGDSYIVLGKKG